MVRGWLNREHIRLFFEVLSEDRQTDRRRVDFWTQYFDQIDMTYFALGSNARYSRSPDIRKLRETLGDLRLTLLRGGAAANNAFIMQMGQYVVVEFGVTGNACYVFKQSRLPVELRGEVAGDGTGLKDRGRAEVWLPHVDTAAGRWEDEFRRALEAIGIRQTGTSSSRQPVNRPTASRPTGGPTGRSPATQIETFTRENLYGLARRAGVQVTDKTQIGGSLFVHYSRSDGPIASTLKAWGFKYGPTKKAWYRRGWS